MPQDSGVEQLSQAVLAQAEAEAKKIRESAEATARQIIAEAEAEARTQREAAALAEAARVKSANASELAATHLEARRRILEAREELIDQMFAAAEKRLQDLRKEAAYARVLASLAKEGAAALEGEELLVAVSPEDYDLASQALAAAPIEGKRVEVRPDADLHGGGCVVRQSDGRALYDNTFSSIVARHRLRLRAMVAEMLWARETHWDEI